MVLDLEKPRKIAGIKFANALMNGAYINSKTLKDAKALTGSASGAVVIGSISVKPRNKNPGRNYWRHKDQVFSLNSYGMPNGGLPYFSRHLPKMVDLAHKANKPFIANLVGFSNGEFRDLLKFAENSGADIAELNLGCPNVWKGGVQKRIISYHATSMEYMLTTIKKQRPQIKISVKISPLPPDILCEVAKVIVDSGIVQIITATNSYPNAAITSGANKNRQPNKKLAGLTGRALKPLSLGVVLQLKSILPRDIQIIGVGGISTVNDVKDYLSAGASAVQIATCLKENGLKTFDNILNT